jgi:hypothetical protein
MSLRYGPEGRKRPYYKYDYYSLVSILLSKLNEPIPKVDLFIIAQELAYRDVWMLELERQAQVKEEV